jgi:hypothetical protein
LSHKIQILRGRRKLRGEGRGRITKLKPCEVFVCP